MANDYVINVCEHYKDEAGEYHFLFVHRGQIMAAFCSLCELTFRNQDGYPENFRPVPCSKEAAFNLPPGIDPDEDASVYGNVPASEVSRYAPRSL